MLFQSTRKIQPKDCGAKTITHMHKEGSRGNLDDAIGRTDVCPGCRTRITEESRSAGGTRPPAAWAWQKPEWGRRSGRGCGTQSKRNSSYIRTKSILQKSMWHAVWHFSVNNAGSRGCPGVKTSTKKRGGTSVDFRGEKTMRETHQITRKHNFCALKSFLCQGGEEMQYEKKSKMNLSVENRGTRFCFRV